MLRADSVIVSLYSDTQTQAPWDRQVTDGGTANFTLIPGAKYIATFAYPGQILRAPQRLTAAPADSPSGPFDVELLPVSCQPCQGSGLASCMQAAAWRCPTSNLTIARDAMCGPQHVIYYGE